MTAVERESFFERSERRHAEDVAAGNHDQACEFGARFFPDRPGVVMLHMCHCSKRRREAAGQTDLPDDVEWRYPDCPRCFRELSGDADSLTCPDCHVEWNSQGERPVWTDDHGDLGLATR